MIRQAHTYFAGAVSGSVLIAAAVVAFVLLVSVQALRDWPLADLGGGGSETAVSAGQPATGGGAPTQAAGAAAASGKGAGAAADGVGGQGVDGTQAGQSGKVTLGGAPPAATTSPVSQAPAAAPSPAGGGASSPAAAQSGSGAAAKSSGGSGLGGTGIKSPVGGGGDSGGTSQSTSGAVTGAVNETVTGVDETLGGALSETGVTKVTEEVVNGVAGPESTVGKTVDGTVKAVGGLLGGNR
jgi:hypothetical protein